MCPPFSRPRCHRQIAPGSAGLPLAYHPNILPFAAESRMLHRISSVRTRQLPRPSRILESPPKHLSFTHTHDRHTGPHQKFPLCMTGSRPPEMAFWCLARKTLPTRFVQGFEFCVCHLIECQASVTLIHRGIVASASYMSRVRVLKIQFSLSCDAHRDSVIRSITPQERGKIKNQKKELRK